jgi:GH35 family endo-1,4-beta-xylanase
MRYFMTEDSRYGANNGIVPFISFDVLNEEIHETRHVHLIPDNENEWKTALRNTSWFMAMTDNDYGDIRQHFVYLLFKFAHIAVPNAQMAARYKANYASIPAYMKADGYHDNGPEDGIDAYITDAPPVLFYNDYDIFQFTKARVTYNMVKELNQAWLEDPLYDGRHLIEGIGIQGHDAVGPTLASDNQRAIELFASLIDEGLLASISISELDLIQLDSAPGGAASSTNGDILNQKQADAIAYQYALLFKVYENYSQYIDRITFWGSRDPGWGGSYKLFDRDGNAAPAYYAVMDPDRFIAGHSYLDNYFAGEIEKIDKGRSP